MLFKDNSVFLANGTINIQALETLDQQNPFVLSNETVQQNQQYMHQIKIIETWALTPKQFDAVKKFLIHKQKQQLEKNKQWHAKWCTEQRKKSRDAALDIKDGQSFTERYRQELTILFIAFVALVSLALIATGILAPLGIAAFIATLVGIGITTGVIINTSLGINKSQQQLSDYHIQRHFDEKSYASIYHQRQRDILNIPLHNEQDSLTRALLALNCTEDEFNHLQQELIDVDNEELDTMLMDIDAINQPNLALMSRAERYINSIPSERSSTSTPSPQPELLAEEEEIIIQAKTFSPR
jgi:hypothetical protein